MKARPLLDVFGAALVGSAFVALAVLEARRPLRKRVERRVDRVPENALLGAVGALLVRGVIVPWVAATAESAFTARFALIRNLPIGAPARAAVSFLALDYSMYLWHRLNHAAPPLWRFHRLHHADRDLDTTTAFRFHPGELLASAPVRVAQTALVGPSPRLALVYEVCMQLATTFHHSNLALPAGLDRALSWAIVTPRMHGIHHSSARDEQDSNWGGHPFVLGPPARNPSSRRAPGSVDDRPRRAGGG